MKIQYKSRNVDVSESMKSYLNKKIEKLERLIDDSSADLEIKFEKEHERATVEATLRLRTIIVRAKDTMTDFYPAIDSCLDTLEKRFKRFKERAMTLKRERVQRPQPEVKETGEQEKIVKIKKFILSPIDVNEAILQMEMLGHEFFVFRNADDGQINVLYRRDDGNYGLIVPQ